MNKLEKNGLVLTGGSLLVALAGNLIPDVFPLESKGYLDTLCDLMDNCGYAGLGSGITTYLFGRKIKQIKDNNPALVMTNETTGL